MNMDLLGALFAGHVGAGLVVVVLWYKTLEFNQYVALVFGVLAGTGSVVTWAYAGERYIEFSSLQEFKYAVMLTVAGAVVGISLAVLMFQPETSEEVEQELEDVDLGLEEDFEEFESSEPGLEEEWTGPEDGD